MKLAYALLAALKDYGAQEIFGIPGDFALPFFREIERTKILPLYTLSHEPAVGFAADAAARFRSGLSVAAVTYGAGGLNMVNAVAQAYAEKSPVVVVSGAPGADEGELGLGLHHQVKHLGSQHQIFAEVTCAQAILDDPATASAEIARVLSAARDLSRPVYIEFPRDMVDADVKAVPTYVEAEVDPDAARACAREIIEALQAAESPAVLLGVEVRRYGLENRVSALADALGLPTATTFMARGILAGEGTPLAGTYLGLAGDNDIRRTVENSDALLMLGVILCDTNFGVSQRLIDRRNAIHAIDRAVRFAHHVYPRVSLPALVEALIEVAVPIGTGQAQTPSAPEVAGPFVADGADIEPADVASAVNELFTTRERLPISSDTGDCLFTAMDITYTELVASAYYATMGPGVPMAFGVQAASGRRPLVLVGDGAFQMTGWELGNCRRYGWTPIVLLFNNKSWGMLKVFQPDTSYNDLDDWRFAEMAPSMGGRGVRVTTRAELGTALKSAYADTANWHLIEIMLPPGRYSRTLTRFADAIKKRSVLGN